MIVSKALTRLGLALLLALTLGGPIALGAGDALASPTDATAPIHSEMISSAPSPGSTVTEFKEVTIEFKGDLAAGADHFISVLTAEGEVVQRHNAELLSPTTLYSEIDEPEGGNWIVRFDIISADDGLAQNSLFLFTFDKPPASFPMVPVAIGALVVLGLVAVATTLIRSSRRRQRLDASS